VLHSGGAHHGALGMCETLSRVMWPYRHHRQAFVRQSILYSMVVQHAHLQYTHEGTVAFVKTVLDEDADHECQVMAMRLVDRMRSQHNC